MLVENMPAEKVMDLYDKSEKTAVDKELNNSIQYAVSIDIRICKGHSRCWR